MENIIKKLLELTEKMLQQFDEENDREKLIEMYEQFVDEREPLIKALKGPFTDEENQLGVKLVETDKELQQKVGQFFDSIAKDYSEVKKKKISNQKYTNPYDKVYSRDGAFIDKKK